MRARGTEHAAIEVSTSIEDYYKLKGKYPNTLDQIGAADIAKEHRKTYGFRDDIPFLLYPVTWKYFDRYAYNFEKRAWERRVD